MKQIILLITLVISILGCSQKNSNKENIIKKVPMDIQNYIPKESKGINEDNYIEKVFNSIKHYDKEPIYYFRINKQNCILEIYVNDVDNYRDYELSNLITPEEVGNILKSGEQKVTVKMYPVGNLLNESWGKTDGKPMTELSENSTVSIEVVSIDEKSPKGLNDEKVITKITSPKEAAGKNYYEFSFSFKADVPYEFEGWTKGQDLTKLDQEMVKRKALEYYKMAGEVIANKDLNTWLKFEYPLEKRIMGATYVNEQDLRDLLVEYKEQITSRDYKVLPINVFDVKYLGNGKLVWLQKKANDITKRKSVLGLQYDEGIYYPGITLFLPEGRDLATQGFMMWK